MDIVARLKRYMEINGIPVSVLADTAQISRPTLSQILSGRNKKVSNEVISKLHAAFPDLNIMWLLFGDGDMATDASKETSLPQNRLFDDFSGSEAFEIKEDTDKNSLDLPVTDFSSSKQREAPVAGFEQMKGNPRGDAHEEAPRMAKSEGGVSFQPDSTKRVQQIMVFYSDNSFEIFSPAGR